MGFSSRDDMVYKISTLGQFLRRDNAKITSPVGTAGGWHSLFPYAGYPNATTFPSAQDLVFQACTETGGDAVSATILGIQHGGNVESGGVTKHLLNLNALIVAAAGAPWQLKLVDLQGYYRLATTNVTGTGSRVLINSNTFTASSSSGLLLTFATNDFNTFTKCRFTTTTTLPTGLALNTDYWLVRVSATTHRVATSLSNAIAGTVIAFTDAGTGTHTMTIRMRNEIGCEAAFVVQTAPTAGGPNLTASSYTNSAGTAGRAFQGSPTNGAAADAYAGRILHSGNAAGRYGAFMPKQGGDVGIRSIESFTWSAGTAYTGSGVVALCIMKPIADIAVPVTGMLSERDLVNQLFSMPKIDDGACLGWLLMGAGATTTNTPVTTNLDFGYG